MATLLSCYYRGCCRGSIAHCCICLRISDRKPLMYQVQLFSRPIATISRRKTLAGRARGRLCDTPARLDKFDGPDHSVGNDIIVEEASDASLVALFFVVCVTPNFASADFCLNMYAFGGQASVLDIAKLPSMDAGQDDCVIWKLVIGFRR